MIVPAIMINSSLLNIQTQMLFQVINFMEKMMSMIMKENQVEMVKNINKPMKIRKTK